MTAGEKTMRMRLINFKAQMISLAMDWEEEARANGTQGYVAKIRLFHAKALREAIGKVEKLNETTIYKEVE